MNVVFEEKQPLPLGWVLLTPAIGICALLVGTLFGGELKTEDYVIGLVVLVPIIVWLKIMRLETRVTPDEVVLRFRGLFKKKKIPISSLGQAEMRKYKPLMEYGGWGIKRGKSGWAYNVKGNEGVQLQLHDGKSLLIGSQRASELEAAITSSPRYRPVRSPA